MKKTRHFYLTQLFPWLRPLRRKQRLRWWYAAMRRDGNRYAETRQTSPLPCRVFSSRSPMYNTRTGLSMAYQENKVFNLKLAAKPLNGLLIRPGETFSFCRAIRDADREIPYREGLTELYGKLTVEKGGGLCMLSNLLFWLFLHAPLTVVERHGHTRKDFPEPPSDALLGVDATVAAGWLDLKVRNDTDITFQIAIWFDKENLYGSLRSDRSPGEPIEVRNGPAAYFLENGCVYEEVEVLRSRNNPETGRPDWEPAYRNRCRIGYPLPEGTEITLRSTDSKKRKDDAK